ncbi:MAG: rhamnulokinase family protein [Pirellulales bacterium]
MSSVYSTAGDWRYVKPTVSKTVRFARPDECIGISLRLWSETVAGLQAAKGIAAELRSVGVDTWGVDFALLGRGDELLGNPYHYRDHATDGALERAFKLVPREDIFAHSGLQFMQINSLYRLLALKEANSPLLDMAETFLMIPDVFNWLLSGEKANEFSDATTTQFFDPTKHAWSTELLERFGLPTRMLQRIVEPGEQLGKLRPKLAGELGLPEMRVVVPGAHDTASAVLAVPAESPPSEQPDWCYISSGTWSLMGVEVPRPVVTPRCLELNFTNEGGVGGTTRLLKNIGGLWLVQECRRIWKATGQTLEWADLMRMAEAAEPLRSIIEPDDRVFLAPESMPAAIRNFCRASNQPVPESPGQIIRTALEGLALKYRKVLGNLEELTGGRIGTIHIVGGGTHNTLLCQLAADATGRRVVAGPVEATAIGNLLMQYVSLGELRDIAQAREVVRRSFPTVEYLPQKTSGDWDAAYERFAKLSH